MARNGAGHGAGDHEGRSFPRLLGNLRHKGEPIKPCIIHGDLWEPSLGINKKTGDLVMYDASSYYAHNEMDLGQWRAEFCSHVREQVYKDRYHAHYSKQSQRMSLKTGTGSTA